MSDRLFAPTVAFILNYVGSPARDKVMQACAAKSGDDPAAQAACIQKERAKLLADVIMFEKREKSATWTIYRRTGSQLLEVAVADLEVVSDSPEKVEFKVKSEKGNRQLFAGKKRVVILSDSDSSVAIDDPQLGKLVYDARIGLVDHSATQ